MPASVSDEVSDVVEHTEKVIAAARRANQQAGELANAVNDIAVSRK